jgi:hypothetical protein
MAGSTSGPGNEASMSNRNYLIFEDALPKYQWRNVLYVLWGKDAVYDKGAKILKAAPPELHPPIERILD